MSRSLMLITSWPLVVLCLAAAEPSQAAVDCLVTTDRLARTFYLGERPLINIHAQCEPTQAPYEIRDYDGQPVARGVISLAADRPEVLALSPLQCGLYTLVLRFGEEQVEEPFCVIPRPGLAKGDPGPWGFQNTPAMEERYQLIAQMGGRYLRFDLSWPDYERNRDVPVRTKMDWHATLGRKYGLQMIPTLGYTPSWTSMPPEDMSPTRKHTFAPDALDHWRDYIIAMRDILADQTLSWPSPLVDSGAAETLPLVRSWEIWNEADQNFYYGPWARYVDLLRIASCVIKQHSHHEKIVYGGACAHWSEMGRTYAMNGQFYFDEIGWHSNGDIQVESEKYYYGSPQLGYRHWLPRPTVQTECYPTHAAGVPPGEYVLRLYATLKAWRDEGYCYSLIGVPLEGSADPAEKGFTYRNARGQLIPKPMYVGYAATVNLLSEASYIGPLDLGEAVTTHLFCTHGRPFVVMWSDAGGNATVDLEPGAVRMDGLGRSFKARGQSVTLGLTGKPVVFQGVSDAYVAQALRNQMSRVLESEFGFPFATDSPYVRALKTDIVVNSQDQAARMKATLETALAQMGTNFRRDCAALGPVVLDIRTSMLILAQSGVSGPLRGLHYTGLWRLQLLSEWMAEAMDSLSAPLETSVRQTDPNPAPLLEQARNLVANPQLGTMKGMSEALLDRGFRMTEVFRRTGGRGAWLAAMTTVEVASLFAQTDPSVLTDVFVVVHFPNARMMTKATLLPADTTHTLEFEVYNFTPQPVSGTVRCTLPDTWSPVEVSADFALDPNSMSARIPVQFQIPGSPEPWQLKWAYRPAWTYCVSIPSQLSATVNVTSGGTLSDGREMLPMTQEVNVGTWVPGGTP